MFVSGKFKLTLNNLQCLRIPSADNFSHQILKPAEKKQKYVYGGVTADRPITPPRKQKKK